MILGLLPLVLATFFPRLRILIMSPTSAGPNGSILLANNAYYNVATY